MQPHKSFITKLGELIDQHHAERQLQQPTESATQPGRMSRLLHWLMPNGGTLILIALLIATQSVWARNLQAPTAPGLSATTVNYQGRLANSGGNPLNGNYAMTFAIYDTATGGNLIWGPETHAAIPVSSGLFSVGLGSQTSGGIPTSVWNGDRYLEIAVSGETLSPRELIRSVPIAGMALTVPDGSVSKAKIGLDVSLQFVQTGTAGAGAGWTLNQGTGERIYTTHITFDRNYAAAPVVRASLDIFDIAGPTSHRLQVGVGNVTGQGFDLFFRTWGDTIVYNAEATWIAIGLQ